jgi:hypothetical protein
LEFEWNGTTDQVRARINDGTWSNWYNTNSFTDVDTIQMWVSGGGEGANLYWDDFSEPAPATNIKSVESVAYAGIKKITGVAIASVKKVIGVQ